MQEDKNHVFKLGRAIFYSSLIVLLVFGALLLVTGSLFNPIGLFSLVFSYAVALVCIAGFGVPFHVVMRALRIDSFLPYIFVGFFIPSVFVVLTEPFGKDGFFWVTWQALILGCFGAMCAFTFWSKVK